MVEMARKGGEPHPRDLGLSQPKCENTLHNRRVVPAIMGDNRPGWAPEIFIMAGAQAALGDRPKTWATSRRQCDNTRTPRQGTPGSLESSRACTIAR